MFLKNRGRQLGALGVLFILAGSTWVFLHWRNLPDDAAGAPAPTDVAVSETSATDASASPSGSNPAATAGSQLTNEPPAVVAKPTTATNTGSPQREWDAGFLNRQVNAKRGDVIQFELTGGKPAAGILETIQIRNDQVVYVDGVMTSPASGRFFVQDLTAKGLTSGLAGVITFSDDRPSYRIERTDDGTLTMLELPKDKVVCVNYAQPPANLPQEIPPLNPSDSPSYPVPPYQDGIISLQSAPGAPGVAYLDFRGGRTEGEGWGTFDYEKPNVSSAQIRDVWKRVAEDFLPFTINVTTDIKVYEAAAPNSRARCIMTPTSTAAPGAGGVAYLNSWGGGVCWSFYTSGKAAAEVVSHEIGHTLGMGHDGRTTPTEGYFGGHGSGATGWAPIMGVGYYQPVVQWSKGEYTSANNTENDLVMITSKPGAGYRVDDTGDVLATARYLEAYGGNTISQEGLIERAADTDAFQFTTTGGAVSLQANPVNGDWANLAISATLVNSSGTVIASNNPQTQLNAAITTSIGAGTYTFQVAGAGRNNAASDGFSNYGSLGYYSITGSVAGIRLPSRFTLNESSPNGTVVGTVTNNGAGTLSYALTSGNYNGAFAINNSGVLSVANSAALDYETLALNTAFTVQYELFVNITNETSPGLTELNRRVVVQIRDVNEPPAMLGATNHVLTGTPAGTPIVALVATDPDFFTVLNYSITAGNASGLFTIGTTDGELKLAVTPMPAQAGAYNLTIRAADTTAAPTNTTVTVQVNVVTNYSPFAPGGIAYAVYDGIGGSAVSDLTGNARFPRDPDSEKIQSDFDSDHDRASSYGSAMRGYLIPPISGNYTFYLASDDNGALLLSPTTNSAGAVQIASVVGDGGQTWTDPYQWNKYASQRSAVQPLVAGQAYYIEARQKDGVGGDHLSVAWVGPHTGGQTNLIAGTFLAPAYLNYIPRATGFAANVRRDAIQGLRLGRVTITDANTNETAACTIISGNGEGIFAVDNSGWISVANAGALTATATTSFTLPIRVTDNGVPSLAATGTVSLTVIGVTNLPAQFRREIFSSISGPNLGNLTGSAKYPTKPDSLETMSTFSSAINIADSYGSRVRALLVPPATGQYRLWLSSDDAGVLNLSTDSAPGNISTIASLADGTWSDPGQWTKFPSQMSGLINLVAGQKYYLETLQKENVGGDAVQVAWSGPGLPAGTNIIGAAYLQPVDINYAPAVSGFATIISQNTANGTPVGSIVASDAPLDNLGFQIVSGNTANTFAIHPGSGVISVNDNSQITNGALTSFGLVILVQDSGYGGLYPLKTNYAVANIGVLPPGSVVQGLKHRYSFTSDTSDSIGNINAALQGSASLVGGKLQVPGGAARANCATLNLSSTFATNASLSLEAWCTVTTHQDWAKVWMFGQPNGGAENGLAYLEFTPQTGGIGVPSMSFNPSVSTEQNTRAVPNPAAMSLNTEYHVICVYDAPNNQMRFYLNGVLADTGSLGGGNIMQIPASEGYLGAAVNYPDANLVGNINEFRIWNIPLAGLQVAVNTAAGPDLAVSATSASATRLSATSTNLTGGETMPVQVHSDFSVVANVAVTAFATNWLSSNPSVATVNSTGLVTAVASGTAIISATVAGATGTLPFAVAITPPQFTQQPQSQSRWIGDTVTFTANAVGGGVTYRWNKNLVAIPGATNATLVLSNISFAAGADYSVTVTNSIAQLTSTQAHLTVMSPHLLHRWSFNNGVDSVGGANATLVGTAGYSSGKLQVPGGAARANCATVNLTSTLSTNTSISIEGWFTMSVLQDWSKVWMFGRANGGAENGLAYVDFTPRAGAAGNVPSMSFNSSLMNGEQNTRAGANPALMGTGGEYHVVSVYDSEANQMRLYINGALADTGSMGGGNITQLNANEAWFGAAVNYGDPNLSGAINEIRIWRTPLNATLVANNFAAGPDTVTSYSPIVTLSINLSGGTPNITWPYGVLEQSDSPTGPWTTVVGAVSPFTPGPGAPQRYYRARAN